jgi:hypothetical protein
LDLEGQLPLDSVVGTIIGAAVLWVAVVVDHARSSTDDDE